MSVPSCPLFLWSLKSAPSSDPAVSHCLAGQSGATPVISLRLGFDMYNLELMLSSMLLESGPTSGMGKTPGTALTLHPHLHSGLPDSY